METSGFAPVNGVNLYYEMTGAGQPLVFIHAGIADRRMWNPQYELFARNYKVLRYDRRGYGKTAMPVGDFSHRQDLFELLNYLNIEKAHLVGCSYGGRILLEFALEHVDRVGKLVIVGGAPAGFDYKSAPPRQSEALEAALQAGDLERASELEVQIWVDGALRTPEEVAPEIRALVHDMNLIALRNETQELGNDLSVDNTAQRLTELNTPALIIWGDLDRPRVCAAGEFMAQQIPGAQSYIMSNTAHVPNMEKPAEFNQVVLNFLAS